MYSIFHQLGKGRYGVVKVGEHTVTHDPVAIKLVNKTALNHTDKKSLRTEAELMNQLKHKNVVGLFNVIENKTYVCMVMEYADGGELFDFVLRQNNSRLSEIEARNYFVQILDGLSYCHQQRICHRDIKAEVNEVGAKKFTFFFRIFS